MEKERDFLFPRRQPRLVEPGGGGGGIQLSHGIILEACNTGCSTYRVQRIHRYLTPNCDEESGSGSGSGSGGGA